MGGAGNVAMINGVVGQSGIQRVLGGRREAASEKDEHMKLTLWKGCTHW